MPESQEAFRKDIGNEIKLVLEMTARVDERVKLVVEKQSEMTTRLNSFIDAHNALASRVTILEANQNNNGMSELRTKYETLFQKVARLEADCPREEIEEMHEAVNDCNKVIDNMKLDAHKVERRVEKIEEHHMSTWGKAKFVFDLLIKAGWAIVVGYLLWKLGLSSPKSP